MFYDLNIPWPEDVYKNAAARNASYEPYIKQLNQYISGGQSPTDTSQSTKASKKKGKKGQQSVAPPVTTSTPGEEVQTPPPKPAPMAPFDALCGLSASQRLRIEALTLDLFELGYRHICYNHTVVSRFNPTQHQNPFYDPRTKLIQPPFPALDPRTKVSYRRQQSRGKQSDSLSLADPDISHPDPSLEQLSRLTLVLDGQSFGKAGHGLGSASTNALLTYDLLAVCPTTEQAFSTACTTLTELKPQSVDIISLDFAAAPRLPFLLRRSSVSSAIQNGSVFEACYASLTGVEDVYAAQRGAQRSELERAASLTPDARSRARRNLIAGVKDLLRITKGRNVIFSSGASDILGLRGPADITNLATIFGMQPATARKALSDTACSLVKRAQTRKTWRGIVGPPRLRLLPTVSMLSVPDPDEDMAGITEPAAEAVSMISKGNEQAPAEVSAEAQSSTPAKRPREPSPTGGMAHKQSSKKRKKIQVPSSTN